MEGTVTEEPFNKELLGCPFPWLQAVEKGSMEGKHLQHKKLP